MEEWLLNVVDTSMYERTQTVDRSAGDTKVSDMLELLNVDDRSCHRELEEILCERL